MGGSPSVIASGFNKCGQTKIPHLGTKKALSAAAGWQHTVLVLDDGSARAFGCNDFGQTIIPDLETKKVLSAAAGKGHTVLVLDDGSSRAFRCNGSGQTNIPDLGAKKVLSAAAGKGHTVLVLDDGSARAFGCNGSGQTNIPDLGTKKVLSAAAGWQHTVLVLDDGSARAFGCNSYGQTNIPYLGTKKVLSAAAGEGHTVLVLDDGSARAFGCNLDGQTNIPDLGTKKVLSAAAGWGHTVLVLDDGSARAFGCNLYGRTNIPNLGTKKVLSAAAGKGHTVLVLLDGSCAPKGLWALLGNDILHRSTQTLMWRRESDDLEVATLCPRDTLYMEISTLWHRTAKSSQNLKRIEVLSAPNMEQSLRSYFGKVESNRAKIHSPFNPPNPSTSDWIATYGTAHAAPADWDAGLYKLRGAFLDLGRATNANFVLSWHVTNFANRYSIAQGGLEPLRTTDGGYFAAGSYTSLNAGYASEYSEYSTPGSAGEYAVLLVATCVGCAYGITRGQDYDTPLDYTSVSKLYSDDPMLSKAIVPKYDTHFIPVHHGYGNQACPANQATAFEIVSRETSQCCLVAICYYT